MWTAWLLKYLQLCFVVFFSDTVGFFSFNLFIWLKWKYFSLKNQLQSFQKFYSLPYYRPICTFNRKSIVAFLLGLRTKFLRFWYVFICFIFGVALVHDTWSNDSRSNDARSCMNYANMLTLCRDKSWYMQIPGFLSKEQVWPKKLQILKIAVFPFRIFW